MSSPDEPRTSDAKDLEITTPDGERYTITEEGSLSLLALGYKGLMAWRAKRAEAARVREAGKKNRNA